MNLKKYIRLKEGYAENTPCSEENKELYESLYRQVQVNAAAEAALKKPHKLALILTPVFTVIAAVIIAVTCIYVPKKPDEIFYNDDNILNREVTFSEVINYTNYFDLNESEQSATNIFLTYDSKSNDNLYFSFETAISLSIVKLTVVINENYKYEFDIDNEVTHTLEPYTLIYTSKKIRGEIPNIRYVGYIKVQTETVYFEYTQTPAQGDEAFFESIQQIVKLK